MAVSAAHRSPAIVSLQNAAGAVLAEKLLSANADSVTVQLDAAAGVGQVGKPDLRAVAESSLSYPKGGGAVATSNSFADFLLMGVKHIWTGYDHLLFLFGLLIVSRNFAS